MIARADVGRMTPPPTRHLLLLLLLIGVVVSTVAALQPRPPIIVGADNGRRTIHSPVSCKGWTSSSTTTKMRPNCSWLLLASVVEDNGDVLRSMEEILDADGANDKNGLVQRDDYLDRFGGVGRLYSNEKLSSETVLDRLRRAVVVLVGIGGVGSWTAEALARSGVGHLVLIDLDDICISNTNRQLHATTSRIGHMKIDVMKERLLDIHPDCNVTLIHDFVTAENAKGMLQEIGPITALIDAIDGSTEKSALLGACADLAIPVVTCGGAAGRRDPFQVITADLVNVEDDRLLASCRRILRKDYGFPPGLSFSQQRVTKKKMKKWKIACIYTREAPPTKKSNDSGEENGSSSSFRLCDSSLGTACFVTGAYGFAAASLCVNMIAQDKLQPPKRQ